MGVSTQRAEEREFVFLCPSVVGSFKEKRDSVLARESGRPTKIARVCFVSKVVARNYPFEPPPARRPPELAC